MNECKCYDFFSIRTKLECNTPIWSPYLKKDIIHTESVQRKYTRLIFNRCNIYYTSYLDRLTKLKIKSLEYRRLEFDLIQFFKLVKLQSIYNQFLNLIEVITYWEEITKNLIADIISIIRLGIILFYLSDSSNMVQTSKWIDFLQKSWRISTKVKKV